MKSTGAFAKIPFFQLKIEKFNLMVIQKKKLDYVLIWEKTWWYRQLQVSERRELLGHLCSWYVPPTWASKGKCKEGKVYWIYILSYMHLKLTGFSNYGPDLQPWQQLESVLCLQGKVYIWEESTRKKIQPLFPKTTVLSWLGYQVLLLLRSWVKITSLSFFASCIATTGVRGLKLLHELQHAAGEDNDSSLLCCWCPDAGRSLGIWTARRPQMGVSKR